jgi:hypothetical protein
VSLDVGVHLELNFSNVVAIDVGSRDVERLIDVNGSELLVLIDVDVIDGCRERKLDRALL